MFPLSSPVTGAAQTGLTSPTYTLVSDVAPLPNMVQFAVTALGGTQTNVSVHSADSPFTVSMFKPKNYARLGTPNPVTGIISNVPKNETGVITRKGVQPYADQPKQPLLIKTSFRIPAGSESVDPEDIRAAISLHIGALSQLSASIGDTVVSGI